MGTNYYARIAACPHCGRADEEVHICKSLRMFRGYRNEFESSPFNKVITSVADWREVLRRPDVRIFDEYGREHDTEQFLTAVSEVPLATRRRQYDWIVTHGRDASDDWLDPEGFSFYGREFS